MSASHWVVVGGTSTVGLPVREGPSLAAPIVKLRLAKGAIMEEIEMLDEHLHYRLVQGEGPTEGWVRTRSRGKAVVVKQHVMVAAKCSAIPTLSSSTTTGTPRLARVEEQSFAATTPATPFVSAQLAATEAMVFDGIPSVSPVKINEAATGADEPQVRPSPCVPVSVGTGTAAGHATTFNHEHAIAQVQVEASTACGAPLGARSQVTRNEASAHETMVSSEVIEAASSGAWPGALLRGKEAMELTATDRGINEEFCLEEPFTLTGPVVELPLAQEQALAPELASTGEPSPVTTAAAGGPVGLEVAQPLLHAEIPADHAQVVGAAGKTDVPGAEQPHSSPTPPDLTCDGQEDAEGVADSPLVPVVTFPRQLSEPEAESFPEQGSRLEATTPKERDLVVGRHGLITETGAWVRNPRIQAAAVSAAGCAVALGATGGVAGLLTGGAIGTALGTIPALFTFGLSIPVGAMLGGGTGLCMGTAFGSTIGFIGGGVAGHKLCWSRA